MKRKKLLKNLAHSENFQSEQGFAEYIYQTYLSGNKQDARRFFQGTSEQEKIVSYLRKFVKPADLLDFLEFVLKAGE